jgi:hypothetical protein
MDEKTQDSTLVCIKEEHDNEGNLVVWTHRNLIQRVNRRKPNLFMVLTQRCSPVPSLMPKKRYDRMK